MIRYAVAMFSLMFMKCMQVVLIVFGSKMEKWYSDTEADGFAPLRYVI